MNNDIEKYLPGQLLSLIRECEPAFETHFGYISLPAENEGRYYLILQDQSESLSVCTGTYTLDGHSGRCHDFDGKWEINKTLIEQLFNYLKLPAVQVSVWEHDTMPLTISVPEISINEMKTEIRDYIAADTSYEYFSTDDWSPEFYRAQAKLGFIAISDHFDDTLHLMPQLQNFYSVIDWENIKTDKKMRKLLRSSQLPENGIELNIEPDPEIVLKKLTEAWEPSTWLHPRYINLIKQLSTLKEQQNDNEFRIWGVTLTVGSARDIAAGELGYSVGKTYTSLSGYFNRRKKEYNNFGKLQMLLLARVLERSGTAFWNLGHPFMDYKTTLGARILPRVNFLARWDLAAKGQAPDLYQINRQIKSNDIAPGGG